MFQSCTGFAGFARSKMPSGGGTNGIENAEKSRQRLLAILEKATKVKPPKIVDGVKQKLPKVKVKKDGNGAGVSPPVGLPPTQLPAGPTGLAVPTLLP